MSVVGILIALGLLVWLAYRGWSILLLAPLCALIAALLANWTQTFMSNAGGFVVQFFPIFLLGALFGKLMEASGSVEAIAKYLTVRLAPRRSLVKAWVLGIEGGPLVSLAVATNILAALTGSASGGLTIALDVLGPTYMQTGLDPGLMHRVAVIGAGTLDSLPHDGAVVTAACCWWIEAPRKLSRYRHDRDCRPDRRARRRYRAGVDAGLVLIRIYLFSTEHFSRLLLRGT